MALRHDAVASENLRDRRGLEKQALFRARPPGHLGGWSLGLRPKPQQTQGCVEEVDRSGAVSDEG